MSRMYVRPGRFRGRGRGRSSTDEPANMPAAEPSEERTTESTLVNRCLELYSIGLRSATSA
eukprot:11661903-Alexandrium_andersonii.AAC.1